MVVWGPGEVAHYTTLLSKCGVSSSVIATELKFIEVTCEMTSSPCLEVLRDKLDGADVVVIPDVYLLMGLGCELRDVIILVQKLLRNKQIVIATSRVSLETSQLNVYLEGLLEQHVTMDTLQSGASVEVDGHVTVTSREGVRTALYKGTERAFKVFPMGTAPGTV